VQLVRLLAQIGQLFFDLFQALFGSPIFLFLQGLALDSSCKTWRSTWSGPGLRVDFGAQARSRLVDQVDAFVGQVAVGDVAARERGRAMTAGSVMRTP